MKTFNIPLDDARAAQLERQAQQTGLGPQAFLAFIATQQIDAIGDGPVSLVSIQAAAAEQRSKARMSQMNAAWQDELAAEAVPDWMKR